MTDRFEEVVRQAAQGLSSIDGDMPSYHHAWQRGRRRRFLKRSALAAAGVLVFIAALSVNLGRFPGSSPNEVDDVAVEAAGATPVFEPTEVPTTAPVAPPTTSDPSAAIVVPTATSQPAEISEDPTAVASPEPTQVPTTQPQATEPPATEPPATAAPVPTSAPTAEPTVTVVATPLPSPTTQTLESTATPDEATPNPNESPTDDGSSTSIRPPAEAAGTESTPAGPELAFTTDAPAPVDATIVGGPIRTGVLACDLDGDLVADAGCELLPGYACTGAGDVRPGYEAVDLDGDGAAESCVAVGLTMCDTDGDQLADTPCIIELLPAEEGPVVEDPVIGETGEAPPVDE